MTFILDISLSKKIRLSQEAAPLFEVVLSSVKRGIAPELDLLRAQAALAKEQLQLAKTSYSSNIEWKVGVRQFLVCGNKWTGDVGVYS